MLVREAGSAGKGTNGVFRGRGAGVTLSREPGIRGELLTGQVGARSMRPRSAGSSPHPSLTEEEDSQTELLIAEEKLSPEQEGQLMPR